jgi:hypothetical protein
VAKAEKAAQIAASAFLTSDATSRGTPTSTISGSFITSNQNISDTSNDYSIHTNNYNTFKNHHSPDSHIGYDDSDPHMSNNRHKSDTHNRLSLHSGVSTKTSKTKNSAVNHDNTSGGLTNSSLITPLNAPSETESGADCECYRRSPRTPSDELFLTLVVISPTADGKTRNWHSQRASESRSLAAKPSTPQAHPNGESLSGKLHPNLSSPIAHMSYSLS